MKILRGIEQSFYGNQPSGGRQGWPHIPPLIRDLDLINNDFKADLFNRRNGICPSPIQNLCG
jgi:hypothetical protein